jgi:drug/metabolite transporter (DMT)-like permease
LPIWWLSLAIQRMGAGQAAALGTLGPVLTVFAAWIILGEPLSMAQLVGLAMVVFGVVRLKSPNEDTSTSIRSPTQAVLNDTK